jgi:hypothetical protein
MKKNEEREESDEVERYEARTSAVAIKKEILWFARSKLLRSFPSRNFHPSRKKVSEVHTKLGSYNASDDR